MTTRQIILSTVLVLFGADTAYIYFQYGFEWIEVIFTNSMTLLIFTDLVIALSLVTWWMIADARSRGAGIPWATMVLTLFTGSVGPLLYLVRRESQTARAGEEATQPVRA